MHDRLLNSFLDNPIILDDDESDGERDAAAVDDGDPTVDATTSTDRRDSPSSLAGVPTGRAANNVQNTQNCQR